MTQTLTTADAAQIEAFQNAHRDLAAIPVRSCNPVAFQFICTLCGTPLYLEDESIETASFRFWCGRFQTGKPEIVNGCARIRCDCEDRFYDVSYDRY